MVLSHLTLSSSLKASFNHECVLTSEKALGGSYFRAVEVATDFDRFYQGKSTRVVRYKV